MPGKIRTDNRSRDNGMSGHDPVEMAGVLVNHIWLEVARIILTLKTLSSKRGERKPALP